MYKLYAIRCPTYENVGGLLKGLKMINNDAYADHEVRVDQLLAYIKEQQAMTSRLIKLHERTMGVVESHQDRITRLEYLLVNRKEKKVSRNPGDREA